MQPHTPRFERVWQQTGVYARDEKMNIFFVIVMVVHVQYTFWVHTLCLMRQSNENATRSGEDKRCACVRFSFVFRKYYVREPTYRLHSRRALYGNHLKRCQHVDSKRYY